jgi:hypothetical protein
LVNGPDVSLRSGSAQQLRSAAKKRQAKQAYDNKRYERAHVRNGNRRRRTSKNARSQWHEVSSHRHYAANFAATQQEKCAAAKTFCFGRCCPIPSRPSRSSQNFDRGRCAQPAKRPSVAPHGPGGASVSEIDVAATYSRSPEGWRREAGFHRGRNSWRPSASACCTISAHLRAARPRGNAGVSGVAMISHDRYAFSATVRGSRL